MLHLVRCLYYLYQWCTDKQISDNEIYLLIKYIKSFLWRVVKRLSSIEDARCLKVKFKNFPGVSRSLKESEGFLPLGPISLDRSITIFCSTNSSLFPKGRYLEATIPHKLCVWYNSIPYITKCIYHTDILSKVILFLYGPR